MNMETKQLTPVHCIYFIYKAFATFTDGEETKEEQQVAANAMYRWTGEDEEWTRKIMEETWEWIEKNVESDDNAINHMASMVDFLATQEEFNYVKKEYFLMDIRSIANSDGNFAEAERKWHDMIAHQLGLDLRVSNSNKTDIVSSSQKVERQPMGFRASWHN